MLFSLIEKLPIDVVGATVLSYLGINDIVRLERACGSKASHQLFSDLIPHCGPVDLPLYDYIIISCFEWFALKKCKIKSISIILPGSNPALRVKNLQVENVDLVLKSNVTIGCCKHLFNSPLLCRIRTIHVLEDQNEEVIEQLSLLTGKMATLHISGAKNYKDWLNKTVLLRWTLKEIILYEVVVNVSIITLIVQTCLELTSIKLQTNTVDDAVVMAVAQHCPKLETLELPVHSGITYNSILVLSERGLPLKELAISYIPNIPTADIARRCSHALSCIRHLDTYNFYEKGQDFGLCLPYMTGINSVRLTKVSVSDMHLLAQYCSKLTTIQVHKGSYHASDILSLCSSNPLLLKLNCYAPCGITDTILIELVHACPHLHKLYLSYETDITDIGILALSEHCTQLQCLHIPKCTQVTEAAVLQLLQRCRKLTRLGVSSSSLSDETWSQLDKNTQKLVLRCR